LRNETRGRERREKHLKMKKRGNVMKEMGKERGEDDSGENSLK
jgi:hypothetical protein